MTSTRPNAEQVCPRHRSRLPCSGGGGASFWAGFGLLEVWLFFFSPSDCVLDAGRFSGCCWAVELLELKILGV